MKTLLFAGVLAVATTTAIAQPFEFQKRIGGPEYDFYADTEGMVFAPVTPSGKRSSLMTWMYAANVDGIALNDFKGEIVKSGPTRISLYEVMRDSPEGTANRDYYARFPAGTDWEAVAREYREQHNRGIAADATTRDAES